MKFLLAGGIVLLLFSSFVQGNSPQILWTRKDLHWRDFKGVVPQKSPFGAVTYSRLEQRYYRVGDELHFVIAAWFNPDRSWVKPETLESPRRYYVLDHEQHHFDMCELYARKIRKNLSTIVFTDSTYEGMITKLFKGYYEQYRAEQTRYDSEQKEHMTSLSDWISSIDREMRELKKYADTSLVVKLQ